MSLVDAVSAGKVIETLENYAVNSDTAVAEDITSTEAYPDFYSDESFWKRFFKTPEQFWNKPLSFYYVTLTEWVARVPGLFWSENAARYRNAAVNNVEFISEAWKTYTPQGKSSIVMGGIGDFILPPAENGAVIMTISFSNNASTGIPVLIQPHVVEHHQLKQGDNLNISQAVFRKMTQEWSSRFPSFNSIKRGYLVVDDPAQIKVRNRDQPVEFHPCTIMEYNAGDAILYDYVFCTADTRFANSRKRLEDFFTAYKNDKERYGRYLIAADANDPLFEADYISPLDLQRAEPDGRSQLALITERVQNSFYHRGETINTLLEKIPALYANSDAVLALAVETGLPLAAIQPASPAKMSVQLVDLCIERRILEVLVDRLLSDNPSIIHQ
ncbi:MAG: hypothetical protein NTW29_02530 [Bacteroidetes bacterium]|nr:hypothetical protein [Bacteroidota bacterium]